MIEIIPLEKLQPAEDNPRRDVGDVSELAQSITSVGLIEPIVVTRSNGVYTIVAGARRFAAAKMAELAELPCIVRDLEPEERIEIMAVENLQREDLTPVEEATAYRLLVDIGYTQQKIAERIGRTQSHISKRLQMNQVFPFEHSEWFRPYAAGYYAFSYLGQDLPRREVERRLEELLALERTA